MQETSATANEYTTDICRIGIRIPPFWPNEPTLWFAQLEGQFALAGITSDETKYNYVIAHLEPRYATEVKDVITSPPISGKFDVVKRELITRLSQSEDQRLRRLLEGEDIGDRTPSQFLRHLQSLAGTAVSDTLLRTLWINRLHMNVQAILASQPDAKLDTLALLADKIHTVFLQRQTMSVYDQPTSEGVSTSLRAEIAELRQQIAELTVASHRRSRSRQNDWKHRSRSRTEPGMCWYHSKFGERARKCVAPCRFAAPGNDQTSR